MYLFLGTIPFVICGMYFGWTSPNMVELNKNFHMNPLEISIAAAIMPFGSIFGCLLICSIMTLVGRRTILLLNGIFMILSWLILLYGTNVFVSILISFYPSKRILRPIFVLDYMFIENGEWYSSWDCLYHFTDLRWRSVSSKIEFNSYKFYKYGRTLWCYAAIFYKQLLVHVTSRNSIHVSPIDIYITIQIIARIPILSSFKGSSRTGFECFNNDIR